MLPNAANSSNEDLMSTSSGDNLKFPQIDQAMYAQHLLNGSSSLNSIIPHSVDSQSPHGHLQAGQYSAAASDLVMSSAARSVDVCYCPGVGLLQQASQNGTNNSSTDYLMNAAQKNDADQSLQAVQSMSHATYATQVASYALA